MILVLLVTLLLDRPNIPLIKTDFTGQDKTASKIEEMFIS
jgi:hypothetical protein